MSWTTEALGDVCDITGGGTPSKSNPNFYIGDIPWATVRDMNRDYLEVTDFKISREAVKESSTTSFPKTTLLLPRELVWVKFVFLNKTQLSIKI